MENVGYAALQIIPSVKGFESKLTTDTSGSFQRVGSSGGKLFGDSAGKSLISGFKSHAKAAALAGAAAFTAVGVGAFKLASDSISAASDLSESQNKVQQVFGKGAEQVFKFTSRAADAFGQTNQQARDAAATFGIFGHVAGLSDQKTAKFAIRMDKLASDLASFHNTSPEQAIEAIGAALRGESEPIRAYGVLLDEASLKAKAMSLGLLEPVRNKNAIKAGVVAVIEAQKNYNDVVEKSGKFSLDALKAEAALGTAHDRLKKATDGTIPPLTQQQKVIAAQKLILDQTKVAQGDFARTSDGLANSQRRLSARWEDAKAKLGQGLLPIVQDFVGFLLKKGLPAVDGWVDTFEKKGVPALKDFYEKSKPVIHDVLPAIHDLFKASAPIIKHAAGFVGDFAEAFTKVPKWAQTAIAGGLLAGKFGGFKLAAGVGKSLFGGKGLLGSVASKAAPLPVFVVNEGFGGAGGGLPGEGGAAKASKFGWLAGAGSLGAGLAIAGAPAAGLSLYGLHESSKLGQKKGNQQTALGSAYGGVWTQANVGPMLTKEEMAKYNKMYWDGFTLNADAAFRAVDQAIEHSLPLIKRYQGVLDGSPRDVRALAGISNYPEAMQQIRTLRAGLNGLAERGVDNGITYQHGGQGPVINIGPVHVKDGRDLLQKSQQASLGGRRW